MDTNYSGDLPAIHRVVSLEEAAQYKRVVDALGPAVSLMTFPVNNENRVAQLARTQAAYELKGGRMTPQTIELWTKKILDQMLLINGDAIAVIVQAPDKDTLDVLARTVDQLNQISAD